MALRIFIADDDNEDLELIEEAILELAPDAVVTKTASGKSAMQYLNEWDDANTPHLIVLDYNMPEVSGTEILAFLSAKPAFHHVVKVVMSTSNAPRHIDECMQKGATKYFVKPSTKRDLDNVTSQMLRLIANP